MASAHPRPGPQSLRPSSTRGYIARDKKTLTATDPGRYLIALVRDRSLKSPELTGDWEAKLRQVERGKLDPRAFMAEIVRYTGEVVRPGDPDPVDPSRLGDCPRCGRPVIEGKRAFGCSGWRDGCSFVLAREFEGHPLNDDQLRELLQRRVLARPTTLGGSGEVILKLADSGGLVAIPVPVGEPRRPFVKGAGKGGARRPRSTTKAQAKDDQPEPARPGKRADGFAAVSLGACPVCQSEVVDGAKSYGCSGWRKGCKFAIWKTIAGKKIAPGTARTLLKSGRSPLLKGFASKTGEPFSARLKLDGGEVRLDFAP